MKNHHKESGVTMYIVNKEISLLEYLEGLKKTELTKLYNTYKPLFDKKILEKEDKKTIIINGITYAFRNLINTFNDNELEELENLLKQKKKKNSIINVYRQ